MAKYDPNKETIFEKIEVTLSSGTKAVIKCYSYDGGEKRIKMLFVSDKKDGGEFVTNKFAGLNNKKDVLAISKAFKDISKNME